MQRNQKEISAKGIILLFLLVFIAIALQKGLVNDATWYKVSFFMLPIFLLVLLVPFKRKI
jgi:hypothetical protein